MEGTQPVRWVIARAPNSRWVEVQWGVDPATGIANGTAFVGYVADLREWIYRDFHGDGAYSELHASQPVNHTWTWYDPYYPYAGGVLRGRVIWRLTDAKHIARTFLPEHGVATDDVCAKTSP